MVFNTQFETNEPVNRREYETAVLDQKKIEKTKNKSPKTITHELERTDSDSEDDISVLLEKLDDASETLFERQSDRAMSHKYFTSPTISRITHLFSEKANPYAGAHNTKSSTPDSSTHFLERTYSEDDISIFLEKFDNASKKELFERESDRAMFHKNFTVYSLTSPTISRMIHLSSEKANPYAGASSTPDSSESLKKGQTTSVKQKYIAKLIEMIAKSNEVVYGKTLDPSSSADFDSILFVKQHIQVPHENKSERILRELLTYFYCMQIKTKSEAVKKAKKIHMDPPSISDKDGLINLSLALPDQERLPTDPKEEPFAETDPAFVKTMFDVLDIEILTSEEFGEGAFHTVKEVVLTLLGGLRDSALHALARIIDFKSSRNVIVHWFQKFVSLVVTQGRWSYFTFGMAAVTWHSRGKSAIKLINNRIHLDGKRLFHDIHNQKINFRVDIFSLH